VELFLFSGSSIVGTVTAPDEAPVEGASVRLESKYRTYYRSSGSAQRTDSSGRFSIFGVEPGKHRLVVWHQDFAPAITSGIDLKKNEEVEVDILLHSGTSVSGRLIDEAEQPVQGRISVESMDGEPRSPLLSDLRAETSDKGHFTLGRLPPGSHALSVEASGYAQKRVEVAIGDREEPIDLGDSMVETGLTIRGRVVDSSGQAIEGASASAYSRGIYLDESGQPRFFRAFSDAEGLFALAGLREGTYRVSVRARGYAPQMKDPVEVGDSVTFVLDVAGSISGVVVDQERRPIESYQVTARPMERRTRSGGLERVFDPEGAFLLTDVAAGTYVVEIIAPDMLPATVSDVQVESGLDSYVGVVRLKKGGSVQGHVVDPAGLPIPGASVSASGPGRRFSRPVSASTTDGDGFFEMQGMPEGQTELVAQHPNYAEGRVSLTVDSKTGPAETRIVLGFGGALEGWLRGRDGSGIPGRIVGYAPQQSDEPLRIFDSRNQMTTETEPDGHFRIENVPAGRGTVHVTSPSGVMVTSVHKKEVEIFAGETTYVDLDARQILVHGQITEGGAPAPGRQLLLYPSSGGGFSVTVSSGRGSSSTTASGPQLNHAITREDGMYELLVDQPGEYYASVSRRDGSRPPGRTVEIPDTDSFSLNLDFGGTTVLGMVLDKKTEEPLAGARVGAILTEPESGTGSASATTGPDGGFQLELEPAEYTLTASAEGYGRARKTLSVSSTPPPDVILLLSAGLSIRGMVTDAIGQGVSDLFVLGTTGEEKGASMGTGRTMADGSFLMEELVTKPYNLLTSTRMGTFAFQPGVRPGSEDVVLTLQAGGRVVIQAWDGNREPVKDARVNLSAIEGIRVIGVGGSTDGAGHAELPVPAGYIELTISKKNLCMSTFFSNPLILYELKAQYNQ
jgi:hypothetical protein